MEDPYSIVKRLRIVDAGTYMTSKWGCSLRLQAYDAKTGDIIYPTTLPQHGEVKYVLTLLLPATLHFEKNFPNLISFAYDDVFGELKYGSIDREIAWEKGWENASDLQDPFVQLAYKWGFVYPLRKLMGPLSVIIDVVEFLQDMEDLQVRNAYKPVINEACQTYATVMDENEFDMIDFYVPSSLNLKCDHAFACRLSFTVKLKPTSRIRFFASIGCSYKDHTGKLRLYYTEPTTSHFELRLSGTQIRLKEDTHKLYLNVYDEKGRKIGIAPDSGALQNEIQCADYLDYQNGTTIIVLPQNVMDFQLVIDATYAEEPQEHYNLTIIHIREDGLLLKKGLQGAINKGEKHRFNIKISESSIDIEEMEALQQYQHELWIIIGIIIVTAAVFISIIFIRKRVNPSLK